MSPRKGKNYNRPIKKKQAADSVNAGRTSQSSLKVPEVRTDIVKEVNAGQASSHVAEATTVSKKKMSLRKRVGAFLGALSLILGLLLGFTDLGERISSFFKSPKEKFDNEKFVEGKLRGAKINIIDSGYVVSDKQPVYYSDTIPTLYPKINGVLIEKFSDPNFIQKGKVSVKVGLYGVLIPARVLLRGVSLFLDTIFRNCNNHQSLVLGVIGDRLYVSTEFYDLQKEEFMGSIQFNRWRLFKENILTFRNDDYRLEVRDRRNNIAFSIEYDKPHNIYPDRAIVEICGYLIDSTSIIIMGDQIKNSDSTLYTRHKDECIEKTEKNWKERAQTQISKIKSIFDRQGS